MKNPLMRNPFRIVPAIAIALAASACSDLLQGQQAGRGTADQSSAAVEVTSNEESATARIADEEYLRYASELERKLEGTGFVVKIEKPFVVIGNESPDVVSSRCLKTIRWSVQHLKSMYFENNPDAIVEVWLFRDRESYEKGCLDLVGRAPGTPFGFYSSVHRKLIMNISTGGGTLVHELVHPFVESNFPSCPSWFNEGLASLYEQCGEVNGRMQGFTNWRLRGLQKTIEAGRLPKIHSIMESSSRDFYGDDSGTNYAVARYLCYYLQEKGRLEEFYHAFRNQAETDPAGIATLHQVIGEEDPEFFQKEWEKWVSALSF